MRLWLWTVSSTIIFEGEDDAVRKGFSALQDMLAPTFAYRLVDETERPMGTSAALLGQVYGIDCALGGYLPAEAVTIQPLKRGRHRSIHGVFGGRLRLFLCC